MCREWIVNAAPKQFFFWNWNDDATAHPSGLLTPSSFCSSLRSVLPREVFRHPLLPPSSFLPSLLPPLPQPTKKKSQLTPANPTAFNTLRFSCAVNASYVSRSAPPTVPGSGWRAGGPPDRAAAAEEREVDDVGVAVGARLGAILPVRVRWLGC